MAVERDNVSTMVDMTNQGLNLIVDGGASDDDGLDVCWPGCSFVVCEEN